jgi:hypothetical protein
VTTTYPEVAALGTAVAILVALQEVTVAGMPLKLTVLVPCEAPKFVPVTVTESPVSPDVFERLAIFGEGTTVKATPLLSTPLACTTTLPVVAPVGTGTTIEVALQEVGVPAVPLKLTLLLP